MIRTLLLVIVCSASFSSSAQHQFSFSAGMGVSKMKLIRATNEPIYAGIGSRYKTSVGLGVNYAYRFNKIQFETGVNYNLINGFQLEGYGSINPAPHLTSEYLVFTERQASYLNIPLIVNYVHNKFHVGGGVSVGYLITNSHLSMIRQYNAGGTQFGTGNNLAKFDFGTNLQVGYELIENLSVQAKAYFGLLDISNGTENADYHSSFPFERPTRQLRNQQFTIGLKYTFNKS